jgi:hypothetical protein
MDRKSKVILALNLALIFAGLFYALVNAEGNMPEYDPECLTPWRLDFSIKNSKACSGNKDIEFYSCEIEKFSSYHGLYKTRKRIMVWCCSEIKNADYVFLPIVRIDHRISSITP